jgi:hypothetical protein
MKHFLFALAVFAAATLAAAQTHTAASIDLKDGNVTPVIGTTIKQFAPINLFGTKLTPELWGLASYDTKSDATKFFDKFNLGLAAVVGKEFAPNWKWFIGLGGNYSVQTKKVNGSIVAGFDFAF